MDDEALLIELEPTAGSLLERHLKATKEWFPHELVPWERGVELDFDTDWDPRAFDLPDAVRSALFVNLLTEDNLPYYHATIEGAFTRKHEAWTTWNRQWTAEEAKHATVIRDYIILSQALDPVALDRARMHQMSTGIAPELDTLADTLAYASMQELATRISHRNTGKLLNDPVGYAVMGRVATDENHHFLFYRDLMSALLEIDPSTGVLALERKVREFDMPGTGIQDFKRHAHAIAKAGIYNLSIHHDQILQPMLMRHFRLAELEGLTPAAENARESLIKQIENIGALAERLKRRSEAQQASAVDG